MQRLAGLIQKLFCRRGQMRDIRDIGVVEYSVHFTVAAKTVVLQGPGFKNRLLGLFVLVVACFAEELAVANGRHRNEKVDTVQERPGDLLLIVLNPRRGADAILCRITGKAARTGILGGDKHKVGKVGASVICPGNMRVFILKRLAQSFKR